MTSQITWVKGADSEARKVLLNLFTAGLKISAGQRTSPAYVTICPEKPSVLLVILTGHNHISKRPAKKHFHTITFQEGKYLFSLFIFFRSSYRF